MLMLQYDFPLPADYAMRAVRERIALRGPQFDHLPGLGWKAFLVREKGVAGASDHRYAPLYLWPSAQDAAGFLTGPFFGAVSEAFGRPRVDTALLLRHRVTAQAPAPRWCTTERVPVRSLDALARRVASFGQGAGPEHSAWLALDASRWVLALHRLWFAEAPPDAGDATLFEIAHFSRPA